MFFLASVISFIIFNMVLVWLKNFLLTLNISRINQCHIVYITYWQIPMNEQTKAINFEKTEIFFMLLISCFIYIFSDSSSVKTGEPLLLHTWFLSESSFESLQTPQERNIYSYWFIFFTGLWLSQRCKLKREQKLQFHSPWRLLMYDDWWWKS